MVLIYSKDFENFVPSVMLMPRAESVPCTFSGVRFHEPSLPEQLPFTEGFPPVPSSLRVDPPPPPSVFGRGQGDTMRRCPCHF